MAMMNDITKVLQSGSDITIDMQTRVIGVLAKIYFPQEFGHYSGNHNDIIFSETPDFEGKVLIPELYNMQKTPVGGVVDFMFQDIFSMFIKHDQLLPAKSKIVVISPFNGTYQFLVEYQDAPTTFYGTLHREYSLTPYMNYETTNQEFMDNAQKLKEEEYDKFKEENPHNDDQSVSRSDPTKATYKYRPIK